MKREWGVPIPSFTGIASGEKSTVVILATDDPYLIQSPSNPQTAKENPERPSVSVVLFDAQNAVFLRMPP